LSLAEKELQQARKDNQVLTQYIRARRKKEETQKKEEEARKKVEEETQKKVDEEAWRKETMVVARWFDDGQSSKDVRMWRK
jgi:hypothetical protein